MNWAYAPAGLLGAMLAGLLALARIAGDDPGFAVERDYYHKAAAWDAELAQRAENERLGWRAVLDVKTLPSGRHTISLQLVDRAGVPIDGARVVLEAFHNARSADRLELSLEPKDRGYGVELPPQRAGLWEFRLTVQAARGRFTSVQRLELGARP